MATKQAEEIVSEDVFLGSKKLRNRQVFVRDYNTPLYYNLLNATDWCKNEYEVINQLKENTHNSCQRYDIIILVNGLPSCPDRI